jgi:hypothetical protein
MPTLATDIIGRVTRLPLKPSATSALLPMFEAVSNGLHAIDDRFLDNALTRGRIDIEILREKPEASSAPTGFIITDNGIGLNEENYDSFRKPDSRHKITRGGKGVGRLGWLKVFQEIRVDSVYTDGAVLSRRSFFFRLLDSEQLEILPNPPGEPKEPGTQVSLRNFESLFGSKCPVSPTVIRQRFIGHFLPLFASQGAPRIFLHDVDGITDVRKAFDDLIRHSIEEDVSVVLNDLEIIHVKVRHIRASRAIRSDANHKNYNWLFMAANQRAVEDTPIDEAIGLQALSGEDVYVGCVYGDYLDQYVNQERTGFSYEPEDGKKIRQSVMQSVMEYLRTDVDQVREKKRSVALKIIEEYPQFLYLQGEMKEFVEALVPGATSKEKVFVEMCRDRFRKTNRYNRLEAEIKNAPNYTVEVKKLMERYQSFVEQKQQGVLAEYVLLRKSIIDILDRYLQIQDDENYHKEEAIHKLIVPMRTDSSKLKIEQHHLWLLDDRLAFFAYFASDKQYRTYTDRKSDSRPDIAFFYDTCFAWQEQDAGNTVVLVEFKRPSRDNYNGEDNPVMQLIKYIEEFKSATSLKDATGRSFSPRLRDAAFHCYIVADLTKTLLSSIRGIGFTPTPDKEGLVGFLRNPDAYVEIISYSKLLSDAKRRNAIFFKELGITNLEPEHNYLGDSDDLTDEDALVEQA